MAAISFSEPSKALSARYLQPLSKEEIWEKFPKELRDAVGNMLLEKTELLIRDYSRKDFGRGTEFWHLEKGDFYNLAIGTVSNNPFFAFHVVCPNNGQHFTGTVHQIKFLDEHPWVLNWWNWDKQQLSCTSHITCDDIFAPKVLERFTRIFNGTDSPDNQLTTRDSEPTRRQKARLIHKTAHQEVSNISTKGDLLISMSSTASKQALSISTSFCRARSPSPEPSRESVSMTRLTKPSSSSSKQTNLITRCGQCGIFQASLIGCSVLQVDESSIVFKDPDKRLHTIVNDGRFVLFERADGKYQVKYLGEHNHSSTS